MADQKALRIRILVALAVIVILACIIGGLAYHFSGGGTSIVGFGILPDAYIRFNPDDPETYAPYTRMLNDSFSPYTKSEVKGNVIKCGEQEDKAQKLPEGKVCWHYSVLLENCYRNSWGFKISTPCLLLTFKNDPDFKPVFYDNPTMLPTEMPEELVEEIEYVYAEYGNVTRKQVWVYCTHAIGYLPQQSFTGFYFLNMDVEGYLPPVVGVKFDLTETDQLDIECSLWSKAATVPAATLSFQIKKEFN